MIDHPIFENISYWGRNLKNRLVVAPMSRISASPEGLATAEMKSYYSDFAKGGFANIITEGIYTDNHYSQAYDNQPGLVNTHQLTSWKDITAEVKSYGSLIIAQLMHAGALSQKFNQTVSASAIQPAGVKMTQYGGTGEFVVPAEMSQYDIANAVEGFIVSARNAHLAGFDGVELHAANGYLLDQFLTEELNQRTDAYGGSINERFTIIREIIRGIREIVPTGFLLGIRLSEGKVNDLTYRWKDGQETAEAVLKVVAELDVDYIHIAVQTGEWERDSFYSSGSSLASLARELTGKPVIANGGLHDLDKAKFALAAGHADLVAIGKAALADPFWPVKIMEGTPVIPFQRDMLWPQATIRHSRKITDAMNIKEQKKH